MDLKNKHISEKDVKKAQIIWAKYIIDIGEMFINKEDYKSKAYKLVKDLYAYQIGKVLFKPTMAHKKQFRLNFQEALSYFIGGTINEDRGFALKPWKDINFGKSNIIILDKFAVAMGNYYFREKIGKKEIKVEYTFGYIRDLKGNLKINLHHSSLPYEGKINNK